MNLYPNHKRTKMLHTKPLVQLANLIEKVKKLSPFACSLLVLVSCGGTRKDMSIFVEDYNKYAIGVYDSFLSKTFAYTHESSEIFIDYVYNIDNDTITQEIIKEVAFNILNYTFFEHPLFQSLIDQGVKFKMNVKTSSNSDIWEVTIDQKNFKIYNELHLDKDNRYPQIYSLLEAINRKLPLYDQQSGLRIQKIEWKGRNVLTYHYEVPENLTQKLNDTIYVNKLQRDLLNSSHINFLTKELEVKNIAKLEGEYYDKNGKHIKKIITANPEAFVTTITLPAEDEKTSSRLFNTYRENLPKQLGDAGIKLITVNLDADRTLCYYFELPVLLSSLVYDMEYINYLRLGMSENKMINKFIEDYNLNINRVKVIYLSEGGALLKEFTTFKSDFKEIQKQLNH